MAYVVMHTLDYGGWRHRCLLHTGRSGTVVPTKSDSDVIFCLQLISKTLTCTLHLSLSELIDHLCINPILRIGLIHK